MIVFAHPACAPAIGSLAEWVAALGTIAAFGLAAAGYIWSVRNHARAQARLVNAAVMSTAVVSSGQPQTNYANQVATSLFTSTTPPALEGLGYRSFHAEDAEVITVLAFNQSEELIGPTAVVLADRAGQRGPVVGTTDSILPRARRDFTFVVPKGDARPSVTVIFTDAAGKRWSRRDAEPISRFRGHLPARTTEPSALD